MCEICGTYPSEVTRLKKSAITWKLKRKQGGPRITRRSIFEVDLKSLGTSLEESVDVAYD